MIATPRDLAPERQHARPERVRVPWRLPEERGVRLHLALDELVLRRLARSTEPLEETSERVLVRAFHTELRGEAPADGVEHHLRVGAHPGLRGGKLVESAEARPEAEDRPAVREVAFRSLAQHAREVLVRVDDVPLRERQVAVRLSSRISR